MSELREYIQQTGELPDDVLLGWIVMWGVADCDPGVTPEALKDLFDKYELNDTMLPAPPKQVDAFKKATSSVKHEHPLEDGNTVSFLCRDVKASGNYIERQIIREIRDTSTRTLSYTKAITATFYRAVPDKDRKIKAHSGRVRFTTHPDNYPPEEADLVEGIRDQLAHAYSTFETHVDAQRIRAVIRDYIAHLNAIQLRSAVYFVHQERADELRRLGEMVEQLPGKCRMNLVPLVDLPAQRVMVIDAFQEEAAKRLAEIVERCQELKTYKRVTPEQYAAVRLEFDQVMDQANEYLRTLEINQDVTGASAELALEALVDLTHVMVDGEDWSG